MTDLWYFAANGDGSVTSDRTYYADRDHPDLDDCLDIRGTYNPPEGAEKIGADSDDPHEGDIAQLIEVGECPWCDDYTGDHVGQHASSAHPEEWQQYRD